MFVSSVRSPNSNPMSTHLHWNRIWLDMMSMTAMKVCETGENGETRCCVRIAGELSADVHFVLGWLEETIKPYHSTDRQMTTISNYL